jgi:hypothetical protein
MQKPFSGSYSSDDVAFLLTPRDLPNTPVALKETLIQSGKKHYSQLLTHETAPSSAYLDLFHQAMAANQQRLATHLLQLSQQIIATRPHGITLVSLARAGTPIGVLLKHILQRHFNYSAAHYSISILRDVGIDANALRYIVQRHAAETLVFVDGWSSKGVIARQLATSLSAFEKSDGITIPAELYVLADLSGQAHITATHDDYLIPSCILNATVSGLVSRSFYDPESFSADEFHGCVYYQHLIEQDLSHYFINTILDCAAELCCDTIPECPAVNVNRVQLQQTAHQHLNWLCQHYDVSHVNYLKLGIGEATRVLLRREARLLLLQDEHAPDTQHCHWLARSKAIPVLIRPKLPYRAVAIIQEYSL